MNLTEARVIIGSIARENARKWLAQVAKNGEVYYSIEYSIEKINRGRDKRWITLACGVEKQGRPALDFFWPSPVPQYSTDDCGEAARVLLGSSEAITVAANAVGFDMKSRCFKVGGGGMDMVYACMENFAARAGYDTPLDVQRTSMNRSEGHL
jgi:hypothetical protein